MDQMAYYNDNYFKENNNTYHEGDTSLICQNNILYYCGETKTISGMINVQENERVYLNKFRISNLNNNQWKMEPHQLYFYIRESVKLEDIDIKDSIMHIYTTASKNYLEETDKLSLNYIVDYYNSLKSIENHLSGDLFDAYKYIKNMFLSISSMNERNITPGFRFIYEKLFGEIKSDYENESNGNSNGIAKTRSALPKKPTPMVTPLFTENIDSDNQKFNNAAFVSVVVLVILIVAIVVGTMTYIFS